MFSIDFIDYLEFTATIKDDRKQVLSLMMLLGYKQHRCGELLGVSQVSISLWMKEISNSYKNKD